MYEKRSRLKVFKFHIILTYCYSHIWEAPFTMSKKLSMLIISNVLDLPPPPPPPPKKQKNKNKPHTKNNINIKSQNPNTSRRCEETRCITHPVVSESRLWTLDPGGHIFPDNEGVFRWLMHQTHWRIMVKTRLQSCELQPATFARQTTQRKITYSEKKQKTIL